DRLGLATASRRAARAAEPATALPATSATAQPTMATGMRFMAFLGRQQISVGPGPHTGRAFIGR
ncbi:hypothetical protein EFN30_12035, partial [Propionibacterium freudenreichii]|nr:hypothetical protein [Propionibacterium freudenreichii]